MLTKMMKFKSHYLSAAVVSIISVSALYFGTGPSETEYQCQSDLTMVQIDKVSDCSGSIASKADSQSHAKPRSESLLTRFFGNDKAPNFHFLDVLELLK